MIKNIGVNDREIKLFEGQYKVNNGMCYNSYAIIDDKIAIMDTVDYAFKEEWLNNLENVLNGRFPDYLIIQHTECDHSGSIEYFFSKYPNACLVANKQTKQMILNFFPELQINNYLEIKEGSLLELGNETLQFISAPFVHWPEVMMTYAITSKALFTADGFGKFGTSDADEGWIDEARRYYIGIVGKYGKYVQNVLKKASNLEINTIYPLHGPVLNENLGYYLNLYDVWSKYDYEEDGVLIAYSSVYGNTKNACLYLEEKLKELNVKTVCFDLSVSDIHEVISLAFKYSKLVLGTITYNGGIFPHMNTFIDGLVEREYQKRKVGVIENGSWAPVSYKVISEKLSHLSDVEVVGSVKIKSSMTELNKTELEELAKTLA